METIFDHNVTGIELEELSSFIPSKAIGKREIYIAKVDGEKSSTDLYHLFVLRGESDKAEKYLSLIQNQQDRNILSAF
jgi:hypothetical protein